MFDRMHESLANTPFVSEPAVPSTSLDDLDQEAQARVFEAQASSSLKKGSVRAPRWSRASKKRSSTVEPSRKGADALVRAPPQWASEKMLSLLKTLRAKSDEREDTEDAEEEGISEQSLAEIYEAKCQDAGHNWSDDGFARFAKAFERRSRPRARFDLEGASLGPNAARAISRVLRFNAGPVTSLCLAKNAIGNDGAHAIGMLLRDHPSIQRLDVSGNYINPIGFQSLFNPLVGGSLRSLDLSSAYVQKNALGTKGAKTLAAVLRHPQCQLQELRMASCSPANFQLLASRGISANSSLITLDVRNNSIEETGFIRLCEALTMTRIQTVNLSGTVVTAAAVPALCDFLHSSQTLRSINLSNTFAPDVSDQSVEERAVAFCASLRAALEKPDCALRTLTLENNMFGDQGVEHIMKALTLNRTVQELSLAGCSITEAGTAAISEALHQNAALTSLNLASNSIGDAGTLLMMDGLNVSNGSNSGLLFLNMSSNFIGDAGALAIARLLLDNDMLQELSLEHNRIQDAGARALLQALGGVDKSNKTLQVLHFALNGFSYNLTSRLQKALKKNRDRIHVEEVAEHRAEVQSLKMDEKQLDRTRRELDQVMDVADDHKIIHRDAEESIQAWKEEEAAKTEALVRQLEAARREADAAVDAIKRETWEVEQKIKETRRDMQERQARLSFQIGAQGKKKYSHVEALTKTKQQIAEAVEASQSDAAYVAELRDMLAKEEEAVRELRSFHHSSAKELQHLTKRVLAEYHAGMASFAEKLQARRLAAERESLTRQMTSASGSETYNYQKQLVEQELAKSRKLIEQRARENLDVTSFISWYFSGQPDTFFEKVTPKVTRRFVGFHEKLNLRLKVVTDPAQMKNAVLVQKSHTVQSLCMHGLREGSTMLVSLHDMRLAQQYGNSTHFLERRKEEEDMAKQAAELASLRSQKERTSSYSFQRQTQAEKDRETLSARPPLSTFEADTPDAKLRLLGFTQAQISGWRRENAHLDAFPANCRVEVSGGMVIPRVVNLVAEGLRLHPHQIRCLSYDPTAEVEAEDDTKTQTEVQQEEPEEVPKSPQRVEQMDVAQFDRDFSNFHSNTADVLERLQRKHEQGGNDTSEDEQEDASPVEDGDDASPLASTQEATAASVFSPFQAPRSNAVRPTRRTVFDEPRSTSGYTPSQAVRRVRAVAGSSDESLADSAAVGRSASVRRRHPPGDTKLPSTTGRPVSAALGGDHMVSFSKAPPLVRAQSSSGVAGLPRAPGRMSDVEQRRGSVGGSHLAQRRRDSWTADDGTMPPAQKVSKSSSVRGPLQAVQPVTFNFPSPRNGRGRSREERERRGFQGAGPLWHSTESESEMGLGHGIHLPSWSRKSKQQQQGARRQQSLNRAKSLAAQRAPMLPRPVVASSTSFDYDDMLRSLHSQQVRHQGHADQTRQRHQPPRQPTFQRAVSLPGFMQERFGTDDYDEPMS